LYLCLWCVWVPVDDYERRSGDALRALGAPQPVKAGPTERRKVTHQEH